MFAVPAVSTAVASDATRSGVPGAVFSAGDEVAVGIMLPRLGMRPPSDPGTGIDDGTGRDGNGTGRDGNGTGRDGNGTGSDGPGAGTPADGLADDDGLTVGVGVGVGV